MPAFRSTTILAVRHKGAAAIGGDGQVTLGNVVMKADANKVRRLYQGKVLTGFAGAAADAFALLERFEARLANYAIGWIRWHIQDYIRRNAAPVRLPATTAHRQLAQMAGRGRPRRGDRAGIARRLPRPPARSAWHQLGDPARLFRPNRFQLVRQPGHPHLGAFRRGDTAR